MLCCAMRRPADDHDVVGGEGHLGEEMAGDEDRTASAACAGSCRASMRCLRVRPLTGSSSTNTRGSPSNAVARPSRWAIPRENVPVGRSATAVRPTCSSTSPTRRRSIRLAAASHSRCPRADRLGCVSGRRAGLPRPFSGSGARDRAGLDQCGAGIWPGEAQQHAQCRCLPGSVGAEEAGDGPGGHGEGELVDDALLPVRLGERADFDHDSGQPWFNQKTNPAAISSTGANTPPTPGFCRVTAHHTAMHRGGTQPQKYRVHPMRSPCIAQEEEEEKGTAGEPGGRTPKVVRHDLPRDFRGVSESCPLLVR